MKKKGGKIMFARVTSIHVKTEYIEEVIKIYNESVVPAAKSQKGFKRIFFFLDREIGTGHSITLWETQEDAIANEKSLYYQEQLIKFVPYFKSDPIKEEYEVIIDEDLT
jgi:heme-degrading monooxygenase HmoA